jgi:hypothetical protein
MKLSKTAQWILSLGILVALLVGVMSVYGGQRAEQRDLQSDLTQLNENFVKYTTQKGELQGRLNKAQSDLSKLDEKFQLPTESVEITEAIFEAADDSNADIIKISSSVPKEGKAIGEGTVAYDSFGINIEAEGTAVQLLNLCGKLSEAFPNSVMNNVRIDVHEEGEAKITLSLTVYCYEGS